MSPSPGAAAQQTGLDARKLADYVAHFDNPMEAEAAGYFRRVRNLLGKTGLKFYELLESDDYKAAVWEKLGGCTAPCDAGGKCHHGPEALRGWFEKKHGGGGNGGDLVEARALIEKLRQDNAQLEKDGAALALAVKRQEQIIGELRQHRPPRPVFQSGGAAAGPGPEYLGGFFAFLSIMGAAALLFVGAWHLAAALFGG
jgi:hypothetical protein